MSNVPRSVSTRADFEALVEQASAPVLVEVGATWCAPCQRLTPILEGFAATHDISVVMVDADSPRELAWRLGSFTFPSLLLLDKGRVQIAATGLRDEAWLEDLICGYSRLGIAEPDGRSLPRATGPRSLHLPAPGTGSASFQLVDDSGIVLSHEAPCDLEVPAGALGLLSVSQQRLDPAYLDRLDTSAVDAFHLDVQQLSGPDVQHLLRFTQARSMRLQAGELLAEDLQILGELPNLAQLSASSSTGPIAGAAQVPAAAVGFEWLAPSVVAARRRIGLLDFIPTEMNARFDVAAEATAEGPGRVSVAVTFVISGGWYAYPPGSLEGCPVSIALSADSGFDIAEPFTPDRADPHLSGVATFSGVLVGDAQAARLEVSVQTCDGSVCLPPTIIPLVVPVLGRP